MTIGALLFTIPFCLWRVNLEVVNDDIAVLRVSITVSILKRLFSETNFLINEPDAYTSPCSRPLCFKI